ncbi:uncharacterized protein [Lepidochelys kempii]|uniref:uncharacterized protein n=1 Tax=Lepidochelys kempii TaxID=8472 RepID=UPI003C6EE60E
MFEKKPREHITLNIHLVTLCTCGMRENIKRLASAICRCQFTAQEGTKEAAITQKKGSWPKEFETRAASDVVALEDAPSMPTGYLILMRKRRKKTREHMFCKILSASAASNCEQRAWTTNMIGSMERKREVGRHLPKHPAVSHLSMSPEYQDNSLLKRDEQNHELHTPPLNSNFSGYNQKKLQEENTKLKHELEDLRSQYAQLIEERKSECFDERRVRLLKAQVMQLERQVVLLTEGLSSPAVLMLELKNSLESLSDKLRSLLDFENHSSEVPVARAELTQMIEICQALRNRLQRNHQMSWLVPPSWLMVLPKYVNVSTLVRT